MALFCAELKKLMAKSFGFLLVLLMLILKVAYLGIEDSKTNTYILENKEDYLSIVNRYTGKVTQDVSDQIETENSLVLRADSELRRLRLDYKDGAITTEEFERDLPRAERLANTKELFLYFYSQYLAARSEPETRYILFSEGWERFFSTVRLDWFSSLVIIIFAALIFGKEYEADMQRLQISTSKGDTNLIFTKFFVLLLVIIVVSLLSFLSEFIYFNVRYGLPNWNFPYQSIATFQNSALQLTLIQATILTYLFRLFGFCILGIMTISISIASKSVIPSLIGGLTLVALPFALPLSSSSKIFLPSPYSLIIGTPFLYASNPSLVDSGDFAFVSQLTNQLLCGVLFFWVVVSSVLLLYIRCKFGYIRYTSRKFTSAFLFCLMILPVLFGCAAVGVEKDESLTVNFDYDVFFSYSDPYIVSLFPSSMIEDTRTNAVEKIIRDPFLDKNFIDSHVSGIFMRDDVLYYSIKTSDYEQINSVNLTNWETRELYTRYPQQAISLLNMDYHIQSSYGKSKLPFMIYGNKVYILSDDEIIMVNLGGSKEVPVIKKIGGGVAFKDGKFYYINKYSELRVYSLNDKSDEPLHGIKAMYQLYIRGNLLYFLNLNMGLTMYSVNLDSGEIKQVLDADIGHYSCDDKNIYFTDNSDNRNLYRLDLVSGEKTTLLSIEGLFNIQIIEGQPYLYLRAQDPESMLLTTYKLDKTDWSYERLTYYEDFNNTLN